MGTFNVEADIYASCIPGIGDVYVYHIQKKPSNFIMNFHSLFFLSLGKQFISLSLAKKNKKQKTHKKTASEVQTYYRNTSVSFPFILNSILIRVNII